MNQLRSCACIIAIPLVAFMLVFTMQVGVPEAALIGTIVGAAVIIFLALLVTDLLRPADVLPFVKGGRTAR